MIGLTAVLSVATLWLVVETRRLVTETALTSKRQATETSKALEIAKQAADAAKKSAEVAEQALTVVERPYVFAFDVGPFQTDLSRPGGLTPFVTYEVANYGKTPANIESVRAAVSTSLDDIRSAPYDEVDHTLLTSPILEAGDRRPGLRLDFPNNMLRFTHKKNIAILQLSGTEDIYFRVVLTYRGFLPEIFFWRDDRNAMRFVRCRDEDYNYKKTLFGTS